MATPFVVIGGKGTGSAAVEAALTLIGAPYRVHEGAKRANPMGQVPALIPPTGELMTESAATLIRLADEYPEAGLAPRIGEPSRAPYLRWMAFVSAAIYSLYWIRDKPSRVAPDKAHQGVLRTRRAGRIDAEPRLAALWAARFPFQRGWQG